MWEKVKTFCRKWILNTLKITLPISYVFICIVEDVFPDVINPASGFGRFWALLSLNSNWSVLINWFFSLWLLIIGMLSIKYDYGKKKDGYTYTGDLRYLMKAYWSPLLLTITFNRLYHNENLRVLFDNVIELVTGFKVSYFFDRPLLLTVAILLLSVVSYICIRCCKKMLYTVIDKCGDGVKRVAGLISAHSGTHFGYLISWPKSPYATFKAYIENRKFTQNVLISILATSVILLIVKFIRFEESIVNNVIEICASFLIVFLLVWLLRTIKDYVFNRESLGIILLIVVSAILSAVFWILVFGGLFAPFARTLTEQTSGATDLFARFTDGNAWAMLLLGLFIVIIIISSTFFIMSLILKIFSPVFENISKRLSKNRFMRFANKTIDRLFMLNKSIVFSLIDMMDAFVSFLDGIAIVFEAEDDESGAAVREMMGFVYEIEGKNRIPVKGVDIYLFQNLGVTSKQYTKATRSDKNGIFRLKAIPLNLDILHISKTGYNLFEIEISKLITSGHPCEFELTKATGTDMSDTRVPGTKDIELAEEPETEAAEEPETETAEEPETETEAEPETEPAEEPE